MADSIVTHHATKICVTEVTDVQVTEIVENSGTFVRAIRIYGTPSGNGILPVLEVQIRSDTGGNLKVTTPELDF